MKLTVVLPEDPEERNALRVRAAQLHAEAACTALTDLRCPVERKRALLQEMVRSNTSENCRKCPEKPGKVP